MKTLIASEHQEQAALFEYLELESGRHPEYRLAFAVPNGARTSMSVAKKLKAEGLRAGVPDVCIPIPSGKYHGMFLELKRLGGKPSDVQMEWLEALRNQGYYATICEGWIAAKNEIELYLAGEV